MKGFVQHYLVETNLKYKRSSNEKVQNDIVDINEDFTQIVHHRPKQKDPID